MTDEARAAQARQLRHKRPMAAAINWNQINEDLEEIANECADIQWMTEDEETLIDLLDGDEEQAFEFRMAFSDLAAGCERFREELEEIRRYDFISADDDDVAPLFDLFFPAIRTDGGLLGYDTYEEDYFRLDTYEGMAAMDAAKAKLKRLTKDQLLDLCGLSLAIARNYMSLMYRHDCLKAGIDILKGQNESLLRVVKEIDEAWKRWEEETDGGKYEFLRAGREFDQLLQQLPDRLWIE